jgi:hypothetical protein
MTRQRAGPPLSVVTQDGDTEGMLFLDQLPTVGEAEALRDAIGIHKRPAYNNETLAEMRDRARQIGGLRPKNRSRTLRVRQIRE